MSSLTRMSQQSEFPTSEIMSGSGSDRTSSPRRYKNQSSLHIESMLAAISEVITIVATIEMEHEIFITIGGFLYRTSTIIKEIQTGMNMPKNTGGVIQSLSKSINQAKELTIKGKVFADRKQYLELEDIVKQLKMLVRNIGKSLALIPSSMYDEQQCAEVAAKSLSKEMEGSLISGRHSPKHTQLEQYALPSTQLLKKELIEMETDLYSIDADISAESIQSYPDLPVTKNLANSSSIDRRPRCGSGSSKSLVSLAQYMEPLYETFFCPLTKKVMDHPVTIESGVTYERNAIIEWFKKFENAEEIVCPTSGEKLTSRLLRTNVALKATIEEWKERNEAARIKVARAALSLGSTENMILEAIDDLQEICGRKHSNKVQIRDAGIIPLLNNFLDYKSRAVRCETLKMLQQLSEDGNETKEIIANSIDISTVIRMLSSNYGPIRNGSILLLLELSKSPCLQDKIKSVSGGILMLIAIKYKNHADAFAAEKANEILENLASSPENIKLMAENGYWEPLLSHLNEGIEGMQIEMAGLLGEIVLQPNSLTYVAERALPALVKMVQNGNPLSKSAAFKALKQISNYRLNGKVLVDAGIMQIMLEETFTRIIHDEPTNSKQEAAAILANIIESGQEVENLQVNMQGHTMSSDYIVYDIIYRLKNSTPDELNINLIRILLCLMKFPKSSATIVSVVKETEASYDLIELINNPNDELAIASINLLIALSPTMGHTLSDRLCKTNGLPESLIQNPSEITRITEKLAISATFLAKLPHQNLTLNLALLNMNTIPIIIERINLIQETGTRTSRYGTAYFEGLVGILVRFTTTLYDHQILFASMDFNFTLTFTELLVKTSSDEVQIFAAIGLENLSKASVTLSRPPRSKTTKHANGKALLLPKWLSPKPYKARKLRLCPIHGGICSAQQTFCLLDAKAVERLIACLDHENAEVVKAALSVICTLLDDKVNLEKSVNLLSEMQAIQQILNMVREHKEESILQKVFWMIERFLFKGGDKSISDISQDKLFPATLVSAYHHGDEYTRQMAEKILVHLNKIPRFSTFTL